MWSEPRNPWLNFTDVKKDSDSYQWLLGGAQPVIPTNIYSADVYLYVYVNFYDYEHTRPRPPSLPVHVELKTGGCSPTLAGDDLNIQSAEKCKSMVHYIQEIFKAT